MLFSCLSLRTLIHARKHANKLLIHCGSANQEFTDASVHRNEQNGVLIAGFSYRLSPILLPFSLSPYPLPFEFRRLLRSQQDSLHSKLRSKERPSLRPQTYFRSSLISLKRRPEINMLRKTEERYCRFLLFCVPQSVKTKETNPTRPGSPTPCKQGLRLHPETCIVTFD